MASNSPVATVVIVNWNGAHLLAPCLDALRRQDMPGGSFETWVVDNASTDGSVAVLREQYPEVKVLESSRNRGFAGGNDLALREVRTPFVVLLNNDAIAEPSWLRELLTVLQRPDSERIGAAASKILFLPRFARFVLNTTGGSNPKESGLHLHRVLVDEEDVTEDVVWGDEASGKCEVLIPLPPADREVLIAFEWSADRDKDVCVEWSGGSETLRVGLEVARATLSVPHSPELFDVINNAGSVISATGSGGDRGFKQIDRGQFDRAEEVFAFCGNGVAIRREVLDTVGLFDEDFFLYYEDSDLSWRARSAGWSIVYQPTAVLRHRHAATSVEWSPMFTFYAERNRLFMLTKNADARLAYRAAAGYARMTASGVMRAIGRRSPRESEVAWIRVRATMSYLRALPRLIRQRRAIDRRRVVSREQLESWFLRA